MTRAFGALFVLLLLITPFSIAAIEIVFSLMMAAWILSGQAFRTKEAPAATLPAERPTLWVLALYFAVCVLSLIPSQFPRTSLEGLVGKTAEYALLFLIAAHAVKDPWVASRGIRAILIAASLVAFHGLLQEWVLFRAMYPSTALDPLTGKLLEYTRMVGPYKNPNDLATYFMVTGLLVIALLAENSRHSRALLAGLALLLVSCLIWTRARAAVLGFLTGLGLMLILYSRRKETLLILAVVMAAIACFLNWKEYFTFSDIASMDRWRMWSTGWAMFLDRPVLGHGINTFMSNYGAYAGSTRWPAYAHNCYLQIAAETGLLGLGSFLLFLLCLGSACWRALRREADSLAPELRELRPVLIGLAGGVLAFLVQAAFDTNFYALRQAVLFWSFAGMMLGLSGLFLQAKPTFQPRP